MPIETADQSEGWYVRAFGQLYPTVYAHRDDEAADEEIGGLIGLLGLRAGQRVLDIACGTGRHLRVMLSRGLEAVGVDLSQTLLDEAAGRGGLAGRLVRGDIRALPFGPVFDAGVNLFTSFGYFDRDDQNAAALSQMVGVLKPGGVLAVDVVNPVRLRREFEGYSSERRDGMVIEQHRTLTDHRVLKRIEVREADGTLHTLDESVRLYDAAEMLAMGRDAGLGDIRVVGGYDGGAFGPDSARLILVGRRVTR